MDNAKIYVDGAVIASTATNNGSYLGMEPSNGVVRLGFEASGGRPRFHFSGTIAGGSLGPFFTRKALTADDVSALYEVRPRVRVPPSAPP